MIKPMAEYELIGGVVFVYLGSIVHTEGGSNSDMRSRIHKAKTDFNIFKKVWAFKVIS